MYIYSITDGCILSDLIDNDDEDQDQEILISVGGYNKVNGKATKHTLIYDLLNAEWISIAPIPEMNTARYFHSCIMVNYTIYVFGGIDNKQDTSNPDAYLDTIEYININPLGYDNKTISELLCINDDSDCYLGLVSNKMYEPKWQMAYTNMVKPRIGAKLFKPSLYKLFLVGGYGYTQDAKNYEAQGALQSIEIFDMKKNEILCNEMGPRLIIPRAGFSGSIYDDAYGYTCIHYIGGRTGIGSNFTRLPLINSCEKMCFPTKIMDIYIDKMYKLFYVEQTTNIEQVSIDENVDTGNPFNIFIRDKYTVWVIVSGLVVIFISICVMMLILKARRNSKSIGDGDDDENTPLIHNSGDNNTNYV